MFYEKGKKSSFSQKMGLKLGKEKIFLRKKKMINDLLAFS